MNEVHAALLVSAPMQAFNSLDVIIMASYISRKIVFNG